MAAIYIFNRLEEEAAQTVKQPTIGELYCGAYDTPYPAKYLGAFRSHDKWIFCWFKTVEDAVANRQKCEKLASDIGGFALSEWLQMSEMFLFTHDSTFRKWYSEGMIVWG